MNRPLLAIASTTIVLVLAACSPTAARPVWTYGPAPPSDLGAVVTPAAASPEVSPDPVATPSPESPTAIALGTEAAPREVDITMANFSFDPASVTVQQGETIRFVVTNPTEISHELVLGDAEEQQHHAEEMAESMMSSDAPDHMMAEPNELEVEAGETGELVWTFDTAGEFLMGCHVPGHWEAGMKGTIEVLS